MIYDGITRETQIAVSLPGQMIKVEVMRTIAKPVGHLPRLGERLP